MQYRGNPFGPSLKTWPKCISDDTDLISVLFMPKIFSGNSYTEPSTGFVNDNHPERDTNLSFVSNKGSPLNLSIKIPSGVFLKIWYSLQNLESVPLLKATS